MPQKEETKERKRMVVEEVKSEEPKKEEEVTKPEVVKEPEILEEAVTDSVPEKVEAPTESIQPEEKPIPIEDEPKKSKSVALWIIVPGIFLLGAILGGIVFYQRGVNKGVEVAPTSSPVATVSATPSSSPSASVSLTKYSIKIFNGSGISGEAGKAKTLLTTAGFEVGSTGNAATYDYTKTIIKAKSTVEASYLTALSTALSKTYVVDTTQTLATSSSDIVQVVIGSSKAP